jgi:uncharacterized OsmC-like protein
VRTKFELNLDSLTEADRDTLIKLVTRSVERTCTVSHTVETGAPVQLSVAAK